MPEQARLRVYGQGDVEVELVVAYLTELKHAYNSVLLFEATTDGMRRAAHDFPFPRYPFGLDFGWPAPRRVVRRIRDWPPTAEEIASFVPRAEQLVLCAISLTSPGFWEFLGSLNALDVIRRWLNDNHERRKDREYRETAEKRKLNAENFQRETIAISQRVQLLKGMGATDRDLAPLLNELIYKPLVALDRYQDKGMIEHAEIPSDDERR
jgi:hypothetical protein